LKIVWLSDGPYSIPYVHVNFQQTGKHLDTITAI